MKKPPAAHSPIVLAPLLLLVLQSGCGRGPARRFTGPPVVPAPLRLEARPGTFSLRPSTRIVILESQVEALPVASALREMLARATGFGFATEVSTELAGETPARADAIVIRLEELGGRLGSEGYLLDVGPDLILVRAAEPAGLFYAVQTLRQLLPSSIEKTAPEAGAGPWTVPAVSIEDRPRFRWRGGMLDCSRHFFPKEFVKRWIDLLAMHKLNTFHWHLTDDQGWRVEIKAYPRLTEVGAWRVDREDKPWNARDPQQPGEAATYGGFYTQDDIREIVAYASARFITVVPEIEMPGHALGALAAYPECSCTGGPFTVKPGGYWPIIDVFCPGNERTFEVLDGVLVEVAALFPGPFIHIGGDEVDKTEWQRCPKCQARMKTEGLKDEGELQSYFVKRVEKMLLAKGKRLIGWDEILEGGLAPQATVMSWRGTEGGIAAAKAGHDVVMSPTSHCYIDYYQGPPAAEPPGIGGYLPLSKVYDFEPVPDVLTKGEAAHILGGQVNLWTEYVADGGHAEYMALPRLAALAEAVWSPKARRDWPDFAGRVGVLFGRYDAAGLRASRSAYLVAVSAAAKPSRGRVRVALATEVPGLDVRYTTDGTDPGPDATLYRRPFDLERTTEIRAAAFSGRTRLSPVVASETFTAHAALGCGPALAFPASANYANGDRTALVDGLFGSRDQADGRWLGFEGTDIDAVVDLGKAKPVRLISLRALQNMNSWIFLPVSVEFAVSPDGRTYETVADVGNDVSPRQGEVTLKEFAARFEARPVRFVRVRARSLGTVPDWHFGKGGKAWLFADEIVVE